MSPYPYFVPFSSVVIVNLLNVLTNVLNGSNDVDSSLSFEVDHLELLEIFYGNLLKVNQHVHDRIALSDKPMYSWALQMMVLILTQEKSLSALPLVLELIQI